MNPLFLQTFGGLRLLDAAGTSANFMEALERVVL